MPNPANMTPLQYKRHMAAVKAAATKRRNAARAAGQAPPPPRPTPPPPPPSGPASSSSYQAPPQRPTTPPPTTHRPPAGAAFSTPKPTVATQRLVVVKALEDLFVLVCRDSGITDDRRHAFDKYKACLARAIAPSLDTHSQNEANNALRAAALKLITVCF